MDELREAAVSSSQSTYMVMRVPYAYIAYFVLSLWQVGIVQSSLTACTKDTRRWLLTASAWLDKKSKCSDEEYQVYLFVDTHIQLLTFPTAKGDSSSSCGPVYFHDGELEKEALALKEDNDDDAAVYQDGHVGATNEDDGLRLGVFSFSEIAWAFENAGESDATYDVVRSNCATVVLNMMDNLDIPADQAVIEYTAKKLYENEHTIKSLRESLYLADILPKRSQRYEYDEIDDRI